MHNDEPQLPTASRDHLVLVLDSSTSVRKHQGNLLSAANEMIDAGRAGHGLVSVVIFADDVASLVWRVPCALAPRLGPKEVPCRGQTALYNAVSGTLGVLFAEQERGVAGPAERIRVCVYTDGANTVQEPATLEGTRQAVKRANALGFGVVFIGDGVDGLGATMGFGKEQTVEITGDVRTAFRTATVKMAQSDALRGATASDLPKPQPAKPSTMPARAPAPVKPSAPEPIRRRWWRFGA